MAKAKSEKGFAVGRSVRTLDDSQSGYIFAMLPNGMAAVVWGTINTISGKHRRGEGGWVATKLQGELAPVEVPLSSLKVVPGRPRTINLVHSGIIDAELVMA